MIDWAELNGKTLRINVEAERVMGIDEEAGDEYVLVGSTKYQADDFETRLLKLEHEMRFAFDDIVKLGKQIKEAN